MKIENLLAEFHLFRKTCDDRESSLHGISRSLDDDADDDDDDAASDDDLEMESAWVHEHKEGLERSREEIRDALRECEGRGSLGDIGSYGA